jgi:hypothetical protein
MNSNINSS